MKYIAIAGRQPEISLAEIEAIYGDANIRFGGVIEFDSAERPNIDMLGGSLKIAERLDCPVLEYLAELPEGKITIGVSDYSKGASRKTASIEALKLKKIMVRHGRSVRVVENKEAVLSTATSLHNGLSGKNERKMELMKIGKEWYKVIGVQDIDAYAKRDQMRPARDAKVGMLPPKLAQILINLCGKLPEGARVLDPFCGTGVVLQEALLMEYSAYGTDISDRMVEYTKKNLRHYGFEGYEVAVGDATKYQWSQPIDAVACEGYLGEPMSKVPTDMELKQQKQECKAIMLGFLKNLSLQLQSGVPVVVAMPAWLRPDGRYSRLMIEDKKVDEIEDMGYNVYNKSREGLIYHRDGQIVARDIIILRKK